ncbi:DUF202 domain-containing protein [Nocardia nova]|jgi:putative membrane protein|uniref:DUF202 domain-containing protein n=2 Tax=Nocardia nova TaxID=37330 RepID=A0A2S6A996_9NOCA|nr:MULTISPECIES: DUF202 domain-containing protein [Nocardia]MBF6274289.1 DUF202 domain-containing protein [Nocardia nova]MBV7704187.1 DUF202 domain-containing protein [Nocardia nova]PPI98283.1 DUF202 domain-containing protein [Nocardia nova]PPJ10009.1 DUF202 domain-containing protein [Nocardia nova]PPJ29870.1 DUF202 domain-containing protein [Nocardia nova]
MSAETPDSAPATPPDPRTADSNPPGAPAAASSAPPGPRSARAGTDTGGEPAASDATEGPELDYRFTLAGERTFLAWIRTALGLLAGGVAVHELVQPFGHHDIRSALAISCIVLAAVIALGALGRWRMVGAAMREGRPLPHTVMVPILAIGIAVIAVLAGIGLLLS